MSIYVNINADYIQANKLIHSTNKQLHQTATRILCTLTIIRLLLLKSDELNVGIGVYNWVRIGEYRLESSLDER